MTALRWLAATACIAIVLALYIRTTGTPHTAEVAAPMETSQTLRSDKIVAPSPPSTRYFFDVHDHSAEEIKALLLRAKDTYDGLPAELQNSLTIAMVLHGPDVQFFASSNYDENRALVDLAAKLDAFGFVDLKMCATSVRNRGLQSATFPPFIEMVTYGPEEINRLEAESYTRL